MKKILMASILLMSNIVLNAQNYYAMIDSAENYIRSKEWGKAEIFIKKALEIEPDNNSNSLLLSNLATVQRYMDKNEDALKNYSIALYMTPNAVTLLKNRASLYLELDSVDHAYNDYSKIITLDPKDMEALYNHGMIAMGNGDMETGKADMDNLTKISPKSYMALNGMAQYYKLSGDYVRAIQNYGTIIKSKPSAEALSSRAECLLKLKRLNDADTDIKDAITLEPTNGYLYILRAKLNKLRFAEDDVKRDVELAVKYGIEKKQVKEFLK